MPTPAETVGIRELRQNASRYVDLAAAGRPVEVTRRGKVVARLVPAAETGSLVDDLVSAGVVVPARDTGGDVVDIEPVPVPAPAPADAPAASEALQAMRDEERW